MEPNLEHYLSTRKSMVDKKLIELLPNSAEPMSRLEEAMRYSILAGGKRLRPILCIAASEAVGGTIGRVLPIACAIEMIHTYSLIHDDLPSMDDDLMRRGIPTNHSVFGEATAILAGDALLTDAFSLIANYGISSGIAPFVIVEIIRDISTAAGSQGMVGGQAFDLALEGKKEPLEIIEKMDSLKTGALIEASITSGGRVGGADGDRIYHLKSYARALGFAFQITDDVLDIEGGTEVGKDRGGDVRKKKATYPGIIGVERAKEVAIELSKKAVLFLRDFDEKADPLRELALYLGGRKY
jgi:geranylgeranyl diphosphate synthase, type II